MVGKVVSYYGGDDCAAVEVRLSDGEHRLFWPRDLEEISPPSPSPRGLSLIGWER
jgi:hypothetical protein